MGIHFWSNMRCFLISVVAVASCSSPLIALALERDSADRFFREYDRVSSRVTQVSENLQQVHRRADLRQILEVLDQLAAAREHLARYDAAHQLSAIDTKAMLVEHSRLRALYYAYEAMAQMLAAQIDFQVTKAEPLRRLAEQYRQTWREAELGIRLHPR